jgi:para-nitrobenzyl esterase
VIPAGRTIDVETAAGRIHGLGRAGVVVFSGIPYAAPPVHRLRFLPPQPMHPWAGVRDAFNFGAVAPQRGLAAPGVVPAYPGVGDVASEDCLVLHVWTPNADRGARPVMVWLHGGGFVEGGGYSAWTDGSALALAEDVVVVSLNHRLHSFGFLSLAGLAGEEYADSGNAGMLDIVAALRWVRENISVFGGDPENVTVFGESGGGWKLSTLLGMPDARGLFHKAIVQSGSQLRALPVEHAHEMALRLLHRLAIPEQRAMELIRVPMRRILDIAPEVYDADRPARIHDDGTWDGNHDFAPVVDGRTLPRDPFHPEAPEGSRGIPLLIGTTRDELGPQDFDHMLPHLATAEQKAIALGMSPERARRVVEIYRGEKPGASEAELYSELRNDSLFHISAIRQAEAKLRQGSDAVFLYRFDWGWEGAGGRAGHALDVPFVFGNLGPDLLGADLLGTDRPATTTRLMTRMMSAWAAFARNGNPNHADLPSWPVYTVDDRSTMLLDHECRVEGDPRAARRRAFSS